MNRSYEWSKVVAVGHYFKLFWLLVSKRIYSTVISFNYSALS